MYCKANENFVCTSIGGIDITQHIPEEIEVKDPYGRIFNQQVLFDWKPDYCQTCLCVGHDCKTKKPTPPVTDGGQKEKKETKAWVPKQRDAHFVQEGNSVGKETQPREKGKQLVDAGQCYKLVATVSDEGTVATLNDVLKGPDKVIDGLQIFWAGTIAGTTEPVHTSNPFGTLQGRVILGYSEAFLQAGGS